MFAYIWEFLVTPQKIAEFEQAYSPEGGWSKLFRKCQGYIKTDLFKDSQKNNRYITIDYWVDSKSFDQIKQDFIEEYENLDKSCETYTISEKHLGNFEIL